MQDYFKELDTPIYQGSFRLTQTDSGGGTIILQIKSANGSRFMIDQVFMRMSNTSAGRTTYLQNYDGDDEELGRFVFVGLDNQTATWPTAGSEANTSFSRGGSNNTSNKQYITCVNGDYIRLYAFTFAQNEYIDFRIRGYIKGKIPELSTSGSTGSVSLTTNYTRIV